ncbi:hypothetical protein Hanom_Chr11g01051651 [Helianthus anomalus]
MWRNLTFSTGGSKTYIPKNFYRTGGSKTYIPKNFYTKTTYITLLSEKFGGSGAPPGPLKASPMVSMRVSPNTFQTSNFLTISYPNTYLNATGF